ncbi:MAG: stage II sporulation protein D [Pseudoflavonifractor sp.]
MKQTVATALVMLLLLFLMPMVFLRGQLPPAPTPTAAPTDTLLPPRAVAPPAAAKEDKATAVKVAMADGTVKQLTMEEYLWRVVAAEMPASFEPEALKAQAVAARTYAAAKMAGTVANHPDADLCTDITCCQAYLEPAAAAANWGDHAMGYTDKIRAAVADTDGLVALYNGAPIQAVFFSSAAGQTVDAAEVWGNAVPYLTGVPSPEGEEVPGYHSNITMSAEGFRSIVLAAVPEARLEGDPSGWITVLSANSAGGVEQVQVGGVTLPGTELRTLLGLRSVHFTVETTADSLTFHVTGYGHGVGMSQYGANALAKQGKTCAEIMRHYYTGVKVGKWN